MYDIGDVGGLYMAMPPNFQSVENQALFNAVDKQMKKLYDYALKLTIWSNLDAVDKKFYNHLAVSLNLPYYLSSYTDEQKLAMIKCGANLNSMAGTRTAVDTMANSLLPGSYMRSWEEYDGSPFHFRVRVDEPLTELVTANLPDMLKDVKAARSVFDGVDVEESEDMPIYVGVSTRSLTRMSITEDQYPVEPILSGEMVFYSNDESYIIADEDGAVLYASET